MKHLALFALALLALILPACDDSAPAGESSSSSSGAPVEEEPTMCLAAECEVDTDCNPGLECAKYIRGSAFTAICAPPCAARVHPTQDTCYEVRDKFACDDDPPVLSCDGLNQFSDTDLHCLPTSCAVDTDCDTANCKDGYCRRSKW